METISVAALAAKQQQQNRSVHMHILILMLTGGAYHLQLEGGPTRAAAANLQSLLLLVLQALWLEA